MRNTVLGLIAWVLIFAAGSAMYAQSATSSIAKNELGLVVGASEVPNVALQNGGRVNLNSSLPLAPNMIGMWWAAIQLSMAGSISSHRPSMSRPAIRNRT
jgi:hypothetical protein